MNHPFSECWNIKWSIEKTDIKWTFINDEIIIFWMPLMVLNVNVFEQFHDSNNTNNDFLIFFRS